MCVSYLTIPLLHPLVVVNYIVSMQFYDSFTNSKALQICGPKSPTEVPNELWRIGDGENAYYSTSRKLIMVNGEGKNAFHSIAAKQME